VSATPKAPGSQQKRLVAYLDRLAQAAGHADRIAPLKGYCTGLLLPGERKSVEPMAARLAPDQVRRMHQSLHHLVAHAPWRDEAVLESVGAYVVPAMRSRGAVVAWIVDDTGFVKKGTHSVGVARQYCGPVGKQENCQVAVSLSVATQEASLPVAWRLYLPESWARDRVRRRAAGVPEPVTFQTKPAIALEQIRRAAAEKIPPGVVLADAAYGSDNQFRAGIRKLGLGYVLGVQGTMTVWRPGEGPLPKKRWKRKGRPPTRLHRDAQHRPVPLQQLAAELPERAWKTVTWREGTRQQLQSRFAALRVRPAHRDHLRKEPHPEEWVLIEWPEGESEPAKYWISNLPSSTKRLKLVKLAKHRWIIERDYEELKQELGLGHYEGRGWRGFHHHATLCIAAYGFLVAERSRFSPSARAAGLELRAPRIPPEYQPRGSPGAGRAA
jgi:SRSO17 transposase